jgi:hypothetical protein
LARKSLRGGKKVVERLSSWSLLGAFLAALVGFGAFMYGGFDTSSANQAGVGDYVIPALDAAQLKQPSEEPPQSSKNSSSSTEAAEYAFSSSTEAAEYTLSAEDTPPIFNDSSSTEQRTGSAVPTETPSSAPPLPVQAAGVTTLADSCTSQVWCANSAQQIPIQGNVPTENASSSTGDDGEDSSNKKKPSKEKSKKNNKGKKK